MGQYIPDITERFPEGFGGVDMTDSYFPQRGYSIYDECAFWEAMEEADRAEREYYAKHPEEMYDIDDEDKKE